jgi:hypothetical protein
LKNKLYHDKCTVKIPYILVYKLIRWPALCWGPILFYKKYQKNLRPKNVGSSCNVKPKSNIYNINYNTNSNIYNTNNNISNINNNIKLV